MQAVPGTLPAPRRPRGTLRPRRDKSLRWRHDWRASDADAPSIWHELWDPRYRRWLMRATLYEFIGNFILIYIQAASGETLNRVGLVASVNDALGHGLGAAVAIYVIAHVTGGFVNPAITLAFWFTRRIDLLTVVCFTLVREFFHSAAPRQKQSDSDDFACKNLRPKSRGALPPPDCCGPRSVA